MLEHVQKQEEANEGHDLCNSAPDRRAPSLDDTLWIPFLARYVDWNLI